MPSTKRPPEPWDSFLKELDMAINTPVRLDCIGGFVVTQFYGLDRPTADVDVIELAPRESAETVMALALRGGPLSRRYLIYIDRVAVAAVPDNYEDRLVEMFPGAYQHLAGRLSEPFPPRHTSLIFTLSPPAGRYIAPLKPSSVLLL